MDSNGGSPAMGLFVFWLMLQLVLMIALMVGGIYMLYCLGRAANGLDRLASAVEAWVQQQSAQTPRGTQATPPPGSVVRAAAPTPPAVPATPPAPLAPVGPATPSNPAAPPAPPAPTAVPPSSSTPGAQEGSSTIRPVF